MKLLWGLSLSSPDAEFAADAKVNNTKSFWLTAMFQTTKLNTTFV